jgi:hypothetical protein
VVAGTLGTANAMFISQHDLRVVVMVCVVAGLVALGFAWLARRPPRDGALASGRAVAGGQGACAVRAWVR